MSDHIKCIIVDDEPLARKGMEILINDIPYLKLVEQFSNAIEAREYIRSHSVDLLFLDIEMPGLNGIEFLKSITEKPFVILCTAYPQFALDAFELDVVDYLVKPIPFNRFFKAVEKAKDFIDLTRKSSSSIDRIDKEFIFIKSERKIIKLFFNDIIYVKGLKDYVMVYTDKEKFITAMNIKTIFKQLPKDIFARVNKSHLINVNLLSSVEHDSLFLGELEFTLGNTYREHFLYTHIKDSLLKR